jgi:hypothetical protein
MSATDPNVPSNLNFAWLVGETIDIIAVLVALVFATTFVVLLWKIVQGFIINGADAYEMKEVKTNILAAVIMLIVMVAVWGIVALVQSSFI